MTRLKYDKFSRLDVQHDLVKKMFARSNKGWRNRTMPVSSKKKVDKKSSKKKKTTKKTKAKTKKRAPTKVLVTPSPVQQNNLQQPYYSPYPQNFNPHYQPYPIHQQYYYPYTYGNYVNPLKGYHAGYGGLVDLGIGLGLLDRKRGSRGPPGPEGPRGPQGVPGGVPMPPPSQRASPARASPVAAGAGMPPPPPPPPPPPSHTPVRGSPEVVVLQNPGAPPRYRSAPPTPDDTRGVGVDPRRLSF